MPEPDWPCDGLLLAEAMQRLALPPTETDAIVEGGSGAATIRRLRADRFRAAVANGSFRIEGRRGAPVVPLTELPISALPYLDFDHAARSELRERRSGERWYEIRVYRIDSRTVSTVEKPGGVFRSAKDWRDDAFATINMELGETDMAYSRRLAELSKLAGFEQKAESIANRLYEHRKQQREQEQREQEQREQEQRKQQR
jgi:hypothetical protein